MQKISHTRVYIKYMDLQLICQMLNWDGSEIEETYTKRDRKYMLTQTKIQNVLTAYYIQNAQNLSK